MQVEIKSDSEKEKGTVYHVFVHPGQASGPNPLAIKYTEAEIIEAIEQETLMFHLPGVPSQTLKLLPGNLIVIPRQNQRIEIVRTDAGISGRVLTA